MPEKKYFGVLGEVWGIYAAVILLLAAGSLVSRDFFSGENFLTILNSIALLGIVAAGMAFVTYSGNLADLSLPAIMAFSGIITVQFLDWGLPAALLLGLLAGLAVGALNGLVTGALNANPILWTLAVAFFMEGFMRFTWSNSQVFPDTDPGTPGAAFIELVRLNVGPVPLIVLVMLGMFAAGHLIMTRTRFGRESQLTGSSRAAARASGVPVAKVVFYNFLLAAFAASIGGIFLASLTKLGVFYLGQGYDFRAVTAVVIGGIMLSGGRGQMSGALGGVLIIGLLINIMTFLGITSFRQNIVMGSVFILVVGVQQYQLRRKGHDFA